MMRLLLIVLAVLLAACAGGDGPAEETATPPPADPAATDVADQMGLGPDGIHASGQYLSFGVGRDGVVAAVTRELREPTGEEQALECGPGPLDSVTWDGLDLYFADGELDGWYLDAPQPDSVIVVGDVAIGATLAELRAAYDDLTVEESTLGTEWLGGGISGVLSGDDENATVEAMWAGATCIAR
jgi:hypothetical protein